MLAARGRRAVSVDDSFENAEAAAVPVVRPEPPEESQQ
jgi:hypothetical protein